MRSKDTAIISKRKKTSTLYVLIVFMFVMSIYVPLANSTGLSSNDAAVSHGNIQVQLDKIDELISLKEFSSAESIIYSLLDQVDSIESTDLISKVYFKTGKLNYSQKRYEQAIVFFEKAIPYSEGQDDESQKLLGAIYHELAQCYKHLKVIPKSIYYYQQTLAVQQSREDDFFIAMALKNIAMAENKQKNYITALDHAHQSLVYLSTGSSPLRYAEALLITGIIYRNIGHHDKSLDFILQAKVIYDQESDIQHLAEVDNQIGLIYTKLEQLENAQSFYTQTINLPINSVKPETRAAAFRELGEINYRQGNFEESIELLSTALNIYQSINQRAQTTRINSLLGHSYSKLGKPVIATRYFEYTLSLAREFNQIDLQMRSLNCLGAIMFDDDVEQAKLLFEQALLLSLRSDVKNEQMNTYHWLIEIEKIYGNYEKSLEYSEKKYNLSKVIQKERESLDLTRNQVIFASYKLEAELNDLRDDSEINLLKITQQENELAIMKQQQLISDLEIKKNRFANLFLITVLSVFVLLVLYILYQFQNTRKKNQELDYLASRDPLTNCYNRRILFQRFNESFDKNNELQQYTVVLADIDSFKAINDTYGHATGDKVIQSIANILVSNTSEQDTVARFGGEEFCILLPNSNEQQGMQIAEEMRKQIEASQFETINVTCSFGVASLNKDIESNLTLIEKADMALYQSKYQGRNRISVWEL